VARQAQGRISAIRQQRRLSASKRAFYRFCLYAFPRPGDNSDRAGERQGRSRNDSWSGSALYHIAIIFKNLDSDKEFIDNLRYHSPRIQPATTIITSTRSHMNKSELIEITAKEADISKAAAEKALSAVMAAIVKAVSKGDSVTLVGFGSFKPSKRAARVGRNPQTGKELKIAATTVPRFTAGATFKAAVAGKKAAKKK
jgi:DNA-binding protein HU-beta